MTTRRQALQTGAAVVAVAALPTVALADDDAELLARVGKFWPTYEAHEQVSDAWHTRFSEVEAMPDCPKFDASVSMEEHQKIGRRFDAFRVAHGVDQLADASNRAGKIMGAAANAVFAIPAQTPRGVYEKMKIVRMVVGIGDGPEGDDGLDCYQDYDAPWIDNALADLERLAGGAV